MGHFQGKQDRNFQSLETIWNIGKNRQNCKVGKNEQNWTKLKIVKLDKIVQNGKKNLKKKTKIRQN